MHTNFVEIKKVIPDIKLDIKYATTDNFTGKKIYPIAKAYLVDEVVEGLYKAWEEFRDRGLGIIVFDAYRPLSVSKMFWKITPEHLRDFVSNQGGVSVHPRGCAVDLTLYDQKTNEPLEMPSDYDEFTERAMMSYTPPDSKILKNRDLLQETMERHAFYVSPDEWWHFNWRQYEKHPLLDIPIEDLP